MGIWDILAAAGLAAGCVLASRTLIHFFQLESYQLAGYCRSVRRALPRILLPGLLMTAAAAACFFALKSLAWGGAIAAALLAAAGFGIGKLTAVRNAKKAFRATARVKRLWAVYGLACFGLCLLIPRDWRWLFPAALPLWLAVGALLAWPIERAIYEMYFQDARRKLDARPDLIRIGITGSFGKTSVKNLLATMLSERYQVLTTPASFNTPMGLTRIIRERLEPAHQVFLAEMGARHRGDIRELCRLVHPTHGVLTSVGPQHLDTFGSLEAITETKYDLIRAIPEDGVRFFPNDGAICRSLYDRTEAARRLVSLEPDPEACVWAEDVQVSARGSSFTLCTREGKVPCETRLLGAHNIQNILLASAVCLELGLTLKEISRGIGRVQSIEHRLQLIDNPGGITLIDDAFNSNPAGAARALGVLKAFPPRRVIVTPGMVELGSEEAAYNRRFGEDMAGSVEEAILVGPKHTAPIREGLLSKGFPEEHIHTVASLTEAAGLMRRLAGPGDTVLFENDLPDNYSEG